MGALQLVYIAGVGYSGTTVADIAIGNAFGAQGTGELAHFFRAVKNHDDRSSQSRLDPFWHDVRTSFETVYGQPEYEELCARQYQVQAPSFLPKILLELQRPPGTSKVIGEYLRANEALITAVGEVSGKNMIVDSSKNLNRALLLSKSEQFPVHTIHMIADCRSFIYSNKKRLREIKLGMNVTARRPTAAAVVWTLKNLTLYFSRVVLRKRIHVLRYEELVQKPHLALGKLERVLSLDLQRVADAISEGETLEVGSLIAGNRVREQDEIIMRYDSSWREGLGFWDRASYWLVAALPSMVLGYRPW